MFYNKINMRHITLLLLLVSMHISAQRMPHKKTYEVDINSDEGYTKANVLKLKANFKPNENYTYYWFTLNKIITTKGGFDGALLSGSYVSFYANSNLKEKGLFEKGLKSGEWTIWYDNGVIKETGNWHNGMLNGLKRTFDKEGKIVMEEQYKNDVYNGSVTSYKAGEVVSVKYYKNGVEYEKKPKKEKKPDNKENDEKKPTIFDKITSIFHPNKDKDSVASDKNKND